MQGWGESRPDDSLAAREFTENGHDPVIHMQADCFARFHVESHGALSAWEIVQHCPSGRVGVSLGWRSHAGRLAWAHSIHRRDGCKLILCTGEWEVRRDQITDSHLQALVGGGLDVQR
jgi:hypothetical protein